MSQYSPYQSPGTGFNASAQFASSKLPPAALSSRLLASIIDSVIGLVIAIPAVPLFIISLPEDPRQEPNPVLALLAFGWIILVVIGMMVVNLYLLYTRSQTIGKMLMKIQIVNYEDGKPADLIRTFVLRGIVNGIISNIPCIGVIYALVDILYIFGEEHRCIHDLIAKTMVVDYKG